jgi:glycosyltransferase involved in cell wall biosynthesis
MHFADVINRYDFIDNVVRNITNCRFTASAATYVSETNIHPPDFDAAGIPHYVLGTRSRRDYPLAVRRLASLLRAHRVDVLHAHHFDPNVIAWAATRLHPTTRLVVGRHYSDDHHAYLSGVKKRAFLGVEAVVHAGAARIIAPSTVIRDILVQRQGVPASKVETIPYPFDLSRYELPAPQERARLRAELGVADAFAVATVGRIVPKKGHRYMLTALQALASELPDLVWLVLGDGPDRRRLEDGVRASGLEDRVRFLGWRTDAIKIVAAVDAIAQPTLQEGYSQVMVEALWMGTPLVITDVSGATDLISSGHTGLLVPRADPDALAAAIRALHGDQGLRAAVSANGRADVEQRLTLERVIPRFEEMYSAVTTNGSS